MKWKQGKGLLAAMLITGTMVSCKNAANNSDNESEQLNTNERAIDNSGSLSPDGSNMSPPDTMGMGIEPDIRTEGSTEMSRGDGSGSDQGTTNPQ